MSIQTLLIAPLTAAALCVGCDEVEPNETSCLDYALTAVNVQIVGDEPMVVAVTASHSGITRQCFAQLDAAKQRDAGEPISYSCMELGFPPRGDYTIDVHAGEQRWSKSVHVEGDACHVTKAELLTIDLSSKPAGRALLADCADGTERTDCCRDVPPKGSCSTEGLGCHSPCEFPSEEADRGTQTLWSCTGGTWVAGDGESECTKLGAPKPGIHRLAKCDDGTGATDCCPEEPAVGACEDQGLVCWTHCDFTPAEAENGTRAQWACSDWEWRLRQSSSTCAKSDS